MLGKWYNTIFFSKNNILERNIQSVFLYNRVMNNPILIL